MFAKYHFLRNENYYRLLLFSTEIPRVLGIYPLNKETKGRDVSNNKNPPGKPNGVTYSPGTNGVPDKSTCFAGRQGSFVEFPKSKKLDAKNDITLLFNVYPNKPGSILQYYPRGIEVWLLGRDTLFVRFFRRAGRRTTRAIRAKKKLKPRQWNYVGITYDQREGNGFLNAVFSLKK